MKVHVDPVAQMALTPPTVRLTVLMPEQLPSLVLTTICDVVEETSETPQPPNDPPMVAAAVFKAKPVSVTVVPPRVEPTDGVTEYKTGRYDTLEATDGTLAKPISGTRITIGYVVDGDAVAKLGALHVTSMSVDDTAVHTWPPMVTTAAEPKPTPAIDTSWSAVVRS